MLISHTEDSVRLTCFRTFSILLFTFLIVLS